MVKEVSTMKYVLTAVAVIAAFGLGQIMKFSAIMTVILAVLVVFVVTRLME